MTDPSEPVLSPKAARLAFLACTTGEAMKRAHAIIQERALGEVECDEQLAYLRMLFEYTRGKPRPEPLHALPPVDLGELGTVEECKRAVHLIAEQQFLGHLDDDSAESYRKTVRLALDTIRTGATQQMGDNIEQAARLSMFLDAAATPDENAALVRETLEAQRAKQAD